MSKRRNGALYKVHDFLGAQSDTMLSYQGLVVSYSTSFKIYEQFKRSFRTESFGVILVLQGSAKIKINLHEYTIKKNDLLIDSLISIKQLISISGNFKFLFIEFTPNFFTSIGIPAKEIKVLDYFSTKLSPRWQLKDNDVERLKKLTLQLLYCVSIVNTRNYGKDILKHSFLTFFYEMASLSSIYAQPLPSNFSRKEDLIIRFAALVGEQFKSQRNLEQYAHQLNISPKYLTETVKEISGKTAGEVIDDFVILEAKVLLGNPEFSISQVAEELHFSDQSFFGKFFKRHTGMSPKQYKNSDHSHN